MRYIDSLRCGIEKTIKENGAYVIGEDVHDPYGGAFKVTKGLSLKYPNNIIDTPMSEQGFTALGIGMALYGCYVSVEIMFGDFITLAADQLINHAAKFRELYDSDMHLIIRFPSGGYRGYGATHSQSIERIFMGIPGIQVVAPSVVCDPGELYISSCSSGIPTVFVENKLDYPREMIMNMKEEYLITHYGDSYPITYIAPKADSPDITLVTYGGMVSIAIETMEYMLYEEEINVEIIALSDLSDFNGVLKYKTTDRIVTLEEGVKNFGWGSEICAFLSEREKVKCCRVGALMSYIPAAQNAENEVLPNKQDVLHAIYEVLG